MPRRTDGFTLLELLVASVVALLLLGFVGSVLTSGLRIQARENQNIPVQQALRGSIEVINQDLRSAVGPRVVFPNMNGTGSLPAGLAVSSNTSITILVPQINSTFAVLPPVGYPTPNSLAARTATIIQQGSISDTSSASQSCSSVFTGSDYGVLYSTLFTSLTNPVYLTGAARAPDASAVFQVAATAPCTGATSVVLNHATTLLPILAWNANTYIVKVIPVTYFVTSGTLYRQLAGQTAQVVAYNISTLSITYLPDNTVAGLTNCSPPAVFTTIPGCAPRSINLTLTGVPQKAAVVGAQALTASQIIFLR